VKSQLIAQVPYRQRASTMKIDVVNGELAGQESVKPASHPKPETTGMIIASESKYHAAQS